MTHRPARPSKAIGDVADVPKNVSNGANGQFVCVTGLAVFLVEQSSAWQISGIRKGRLLVDLSQRATQGTLKVRRELGGHHHFSINLAPVDNERSVTYSVNRALLLAGSINVCGNPL